MIHFSQQQQVDRMIHFSHMSCQDSDHQRNVCGLLAVTAMMPTVTVNNHTITVAPHPNQLFITTKSSLLEGAAVGEVRFPRFGHPGQVLSATLSFLGPPTPHPHHPQFLYPHSPVTSDSRGLDTMRAALAMFSVPVSSLTSDVRFPRFGHHACCPGHVLSSCILTHQ